MKWCPVGLGLVVLLALASCDQGQTPREKAGPNAPSRTTQESSKVTPQEVQKEVGEAGRTIGRFAEQKEEEYMQEIQQRIAALQPKIDELKERGKDLSGEARQKWEQTLTQLQKKKQKAEQKLDQLKSSRDGAWKEVQQGAESAWKELSEAYRRAADQFQEGSAP